MCYVHLNETCLRKYGRELTASEWIRLGEQAVDAGTLGLTITGGEPLIRSDFPEIYTAFTEMGFQITLQTNLSLLDGNLIDLIAERPPMRIKSTIYGATEEMYEKVCKVKNGLKRVKRGIENVLHAKIPLVLVSTVIKENQEELEAMYELAASYGIHMRHTHNVMNSRRNENEKNIVTSRILFEDLSNEERSALHVKPHKPVKTPLDVCGNYKNGGYWILWNGHLSLCAHMDMNYLPLQKNQGSEETIEKCFYQMIQDLEQQYPEGCCKECKNSQYCMTCPATFYAENTKLGEGKCQTAYRMKMCAEN